MVNGELPDGWKIIELENCVDILDNRRKPINAGEREKRIAGKDEAKLYPYYGATGKVGLIDDYLLDEEVVLLGEDGAPFLDFGKDKAYVVRGKSWVNNHAHVLKARDGLLTNLFLMHYLNYFDYHGYVTGTTRLKLNQGQMRQFPIKVPPPPEQERIVAKIEELFTQLEAGTSALERVQTGLRRYKASVLKAAVEGKLLNDEGRMQKDGELPVGWKLLTIEEACERIVDCLHSTPKFAETGHYCVDSTWIKPGIFIFEKARFVDNTTFVERNRRMKPQENDVVFSREGALLGVAVRVPENFDFCLGQRMMIFRPQDSLDSKYLEAFLNSKAFRSQYAPLITGTASPHLNIGDIRKFTIPLPPLEEQRRIVAEVERRLSVAREVESVVEKALARSARLRQSVLKNAFEGKLI